MHRPKSAKTLKHTAYFLTILHCFLLQYKLLGKTEALFKVENYSSRKIKKNNLKI